MLAGICVAAKVAHCLDTTHRATASISQTPSLRSTDGERHTQTHTHTHTRTHTHTHTHARSRTSASSTLLKTTHHALPCLFLSPSHALDRAATQTLRLLLLSHKMRMIATGAFSLDHTSSSTSTQVWASISVMTHHQTCALKLLLLLLLLLPSQYLSVSLCLCLSLSVAVCRCLSLSLSLSLSVAVSLFRLFMSSLTPFSHSPPTPLFLFPPTTATLFAAQTPLLMVFGHQWVPTTGQSFETTSTASLPSARSTLSRVGSSHSFV